MKLTQVAWMTLIVYTQYELLNNKVTQTTVWVLYLAEVVYDLSVMISIRLIIYFLFRIGNLLAIKLELIKKAKLHLSTLPVQYLHILIH